MKKFFKSMALSLVVAVFAICCLAGCGSNDEFKKGQKATATEMFAVASEANNEFGTSYSAYTIVKMGKQTMLEVDMQLVLAEESIEAAIKMAGDPALAGEMGGFASVEAYITGGYSYVNTAGQKVKAPFDMEGEMPSEIAGALQTSDIADTLMDTLDMYAQLEGQGFDFKVRKLVDETTGLVRYKLYVEENGAKSTMIVGYLDGQIVEFEMEGEAEGMYTLVSIKTLPADATIEFPADLDTYTEAV